MPSPEISHDSSFVEPSQTTIKSVELAKENKLSDVLEEIDIRIESIPHCNNAANIRSELDGIKRSLGELNMLLQNADKISLQETSDKLKVVAQQLGELRKGDVEVHSSDTTLLSMYNILKQDIERVVKNITAYLTIIDKRKNLENYTENLMRNGVKGDEIFLAKSLRMTLGGIGFGVHLHYRESADNIKGMIEGSKSLDIDSKINILFVSFKNHVNALAAKGDHIFADIKDKMQDSWDERSPRDNLTFLVSQLGVIFKLGKVDALFKHIANGCADLIQGGTFSH